MHRKKRASNVGSSWAGGTHQDSTVDCTGAQTDMTRSCVGTEEWPPQKCEAISMIHSTENAFSFSYYSRKVKQRPECPEIMHPRAMAARHLRHIGGSRFVIMQIAEHLPSMHKTLGSTPSITHTHTQKINKKHIYRS